MKTTEIEKEFARLLNEFIQEQGEVDWNKMTFLHFAVWLNCRVDSSAS